MSRKYFIEFFAKGCLSISILCGCMQLANSQTAPAQETWKDPATGLIWAVKDNNSDVNYTQARDFCSNLRVGGFSDWRLGSIDELDALFDSKSKQPFKIKGPIQLGASGVWSGTALPSGGEVWTFYFAYGGRSPLRTSGHSSYGRALCVRAEK
jgi:hypothetical protein